MNVVSTQNNFSAGEWAPSLYGRSDQAKYQSACRQMKNWVVQPHGGASTRPGTYYAGKLVDETTTARLIPFQFSVTDNYVLVFGDETMHVMKGYDYVRYGIGNAFETTLDGLELLRSGGLQIAMGSRVSAGAQRLYVEGTHNASAMDIDSSTPNYYHVAHDTTPTWFGSSYDCPPTLITQVHGDFSVATRVQFTSAPSGEAWLALVIRDKAHPLLTTELIALKKTAGGTYTIRGSSLDSTFTETTYIEDAYSNAEVWLRCERVGNLFTFYWSSSVGSVPAEGSWTPSNAGTNNNISAEAEICLMFASPGGTAGTALFGEIEDLVADWAEDPTVLASYGEPYEVATPYAIEDVPTVKYSQTADTMYLTHPDYAPQKLTRSADDAWTFTSITFGSSQAAPTNPMSGAGTDDKFVVTAMSATGEESLPSTALSASDDNVISWTAPTGAAWYSIYKDPGGTHGFYGWVADIALAAGEGVAKAISGITKANPAVVTTTSAHGYTAGDYVVINSVVGMTEVNGGYYIVGESPTTYQFHLHAVSTAANLDTSGVGYTAYSSGGSVRKCGTWKVQNIDPDWEATPPEDSGFFNATDEYPGSCAFYEQRMVYARSNDYPQTIWGSCIGRYDNFNTSHALRDDESYEFTLDSRQQNAILWLLPMDRLLIGTAGNEWKMDGGTSSDTITPTAVNVRVQSQWGSADIPPLVIGDTVLYVQYGGRNIRELAYSLEADRFVGTDLTILANHLFEGRTIISWCYQRMPRSVVWCVMSDGTLLGLTYLKEHKIWAWHQHETQGYVEGACVVPDGAGNDVLYLLTRRTIAYQTRRYIEVLQEIETSDVEDAFCVDCGMTYDGSAATTIYGLEHLEDKTVVALADGFVITGLTVDNGTVTLPSAASVVHVGLGYTCDLETFEFAPATETENTLTRRRRVVAATLILHASRSLWIGPDSSHLVEVNMRSDEAIGEPTELYTGTKPEIELVPGEFDESRLFLRVTDPIPTSVLSIVARLDIGGV